MGSVTAVSNSTPLLLKTFIGALSGLFLLIATLASQAATDTGIADTGVYVEYRQSDQPGAPVVDRWRLYGASYALVIGIDNYTNGWPRLSNAIKDATLVADELKNQGFEVELLTDVTGSQLRQALRRFFAFKGKDPQARLFVWFAGHGHTENGEGYLVPADAPLPGSPEFNFSALHMGDVGAMVRIAQSKHVLAVFDSCFAGTIFASQRARPPAAITAAVKRPVRQFLTSGDAEQKVSDDGTFRTLFLRALLGEETADANRDGYLTGTELSFYLEDRVINLTQGLQTPRGGKLRDPKFDQGDFVFVLPRPEAQLAALPVAPEVVQPNVASQSSEEAAYELAFWDAIKESKAVGDYEAYLEAYPAGRFVPLAEARISSLGGRQSAAASASASEAQEARLPPEPLQAPAIEDLDITYVAVKNANVRVEPDAASRQLGRLARNDEVLVTGRVIGKNWYRISFQNQQAYVFGPLIKEMAVEPDRSFETSETVFWQLIAVSDNPADFEAYLKKFPDGTFVELARNRLAALRTSAAPSKPPLEGGQAGQSATRIDPNSEWIGNVIWYRPDGQRVAQEADCEIQVKLAAFNHREYFRCSRWQWGLGFSVGEDGVISEGSIWSTRGPVYQLNGTIWDMSGTWNEWQVSIKLSQKN